MNFFTEYNILKENIKISLLNLKSNKLRTAITISIISVGITALISILTAIDTIKKSFTESFLLLGANSFRISSRSVYGNKEYTKTYVPITYEECKKFKNNFKLPSLISITCKVPTTTRIRFENRSTNHNVSIYGVDENYFQLSNFDFEEGRNFNLNETQNGLQVAIIGYDIKTKLFADKTPIIGKKITIKDKVFLIVGVLKSKGSTFGISNDNNCFVPIKTTITYFSSENISFTINVMPFNTHILDFAINEAENVFRIIRKIKPHEESNFEIQKSNSLVNILLENIKYVSLASVIIGIITLIDSIVSLMNIMLVAVNERIREVGLRKSIGATSRNIKQQFLMETIIIGQLGGILGIISGVIIGNIIALFLKTSFVFPFWWVLSGFLICLLVSIFAGFIPAQKAAKLNPIVALKVE